MGPMSPMGTMSPMGPMSPMNPINAMNMAMFQQQQQQHQQYSQSSGSPTPPLLSLPQSLLNNNSAPSSPHNIRPICGPPPSSPMGYYSQGRQSPSLSAPLINNNRRFSRPLLDEVEESNSRTQSPILRKSPVVSTSSTTTVRS
jgi:hypothetical protein